MPRRGGFLSVARLSLGGLGFVRPEMGSSCLFGRVRPCCAPPGGLGFVRPEMGSSCLSGRVRAAFLPVAWGFFARRRGAPASSGGSVHCGAAPTLRRLQRALYGDGSLGSRTAGPLSDTLPYALRPNPMLPSTSKHAGTLTLYVELLENRLRSERMFVALYELSVLLYTLKLSSTDS